MNDGGIVFDVTHVRGFAEDLWYRIGDDGPWGSEIKRALALITGGDGGKAKEGLEDGGSGSELATFGLSGHDYFGTVMGKRQGENLAALVKFAEDASLSVQDLAKGAAVIAEKLGSTDSANGKDVEQVYKDFEETPPHGLYGGQS